MDAAAKGIMILSRGFLGPAIIHLATEKALHIHCLEHDIISCSIDKIAETTAGITDKLQIYGMKPSSLLTISKSIALAISASLLPYVGGFIDRSGHLHRAGMTVSCIIACVNFSMIFLSLKNLELAWILTIFTDVLFQIHNMIILTYLQQLTPTVSRLSSCEYLF
jgi:MFS-type transporter involved in bile tolerance (Atg22 family)